MTWNASQPAVANQVGTDIVAIEENFAEIKAILETVLIGTVGSTLSNSFYLDHAAGEDSGTFMRGTAGTSTNAGATTAWFFLFVAPPGWTISATGAGSVLACWDDSGSYNVSQAQGYGHTAGTWTQPNHTHDGNTHTHLYDHEHVIPFNLQTSEHGYYNSGTDHSSTASGSMDQDATGSTGSYGTKVYVETLGGPATNPTDNNTAFDTGESATTNTWRPYAAVGSLFFLDSGE